MKVSISKIKPSPDNAKGRSEMNEEMEELVSTIKALGVVEPITVFENGDGYEIIEGERRWFAAQRVGLKEVDVYVRDVTPEQARLMRLASEAHKPKEYEQFSEMVMRELDERDIEIATLCKETGLNRHRLLRANNYAKSKYEGIVIEVGDKVMYRATGELWSRFSEICAMAHIKRIADKASTEWKTHEHFIDMCRRIREALPNKVAFGDPGDKDYEEHNFELEAILAIPFSTGKEYEDRVIRKAKVKEKNARGKWETERFKNVDIKAFVKDAARWKEKLNDFIEKSNKITAEQAPFLKREIKEIIKEQDDLKAALLKVLKNLDEAIASKRGM